MDDADDVPGADGDAETGASEADAPPDAETDGDPEAGEPADGTADAAGSEDAPDEDGDEAPDPEEALTIDDALVPSAERSLDLSMDVNVSGEVSFADAIEIIETISFREVECHYGTDGGINGYNFEDGAAAAHYLRVLAGDSGDYRQEGWQYVIEEEPGPLEKRDKPYEIYTGLPGPKAIEPGTPELQGMGLASNRIGYTVQIPLASAAGDEEWLYVRNWFDMEQTYDEVDKLDVMYDLLSDLRLSKRL